MRRDLLVLSALFAFSCTVLAADRSLDIDIDTPSAAEAFVDLDGDGIDDNFTDTDRDGIPDKYVLGAVSAFGAEITASSGIFAAAKSGKFSATLTTGNRDVFGSRMGRTHCLSLNRGGFGSDSDFGPGNGIGLGSVKGTGCVGGVCF